MATTTATEALVAEPAVEASPTLLSQARKFLWVASGLFSTSSLTIAFLDYFFAEAYEPAATHFIAAVAAGVLFFVASFLKLGPEEA